MVPVWLMVQRIAFIVPVAPIRGRGHVHRLTKLEGQVNQNPPVGMARVDAVRGRFRSFLLAGLNYFLSDHQDRTSAQKRGGGQPMLSFMDGSDADERYRLEPVDERTPAKGVCPKCLFVQASAGMLEQKAEGRKQSTEASDDWRKAAGHGRGRRRGTLQGFNPRPARAGGATAALSGDWAAGVL